MLRALVADSRWLGLAAATLLVFPTAAAAQQAIPEHSLAGLEFRQVGPATMGGRIADLAVDEANPATFYVGTATGGLWKTTNHGISFAPIFDDQRTASIGALALAPSNPNVLWVGTGEPQNRQSSPYGAGVFRTVDGGRTWQDLGLEATRHIGEIEVHPTDPDVAYVAAVGHLWGPNEERGVYKTTDGGASWEKVLYIDEHTGVTDLAMHRADPCTLFAAAYQRQRTAFGFSAAGSGSGLYRTVDCGRSWTRLTEGLPEGDLGRIGIDIWRQDPNYVVIRVEGGGQESGVYRSRDRGESWEHMGTTNPRPMYFVKLVIDPNDAERVYMGGVQLMISDDGGYEFRNDAREVHSDHHALWVDPNNSDHLIMGSDGGVSVSFDRAESWRMYDNIVLAQSYEVGYDMRDPYYVCTGLQDNGTWCGPTAVWNRNGIRNQQWFNIHGGDGFYAAVDPTDWRTAYAESQNGNISRVDLVTGERLSIRPAARPGNGIAEDTRLQWNWNTPLRISVHDPATIFTGSNYLLRSQDRGQSWYAISPDLTARVDRDTMTIMGERVTGATLSRNDGISYYGNITTLAESPSEADIIWVGTDDGNVQVTRDGGATWTDVTDNLPGVPALTYVTRVRASAAAPGRAYVTLDGHYQDDYNPYVFVTEDFGERWTRITNGLPMESVNGFLEHPSAPNLLFAGNEVGLWFSIDRGRNWQELAAGLPTVPVDDIVLHPRENDLILGTHGRGIWILHDVSPLEQTSAATLAKAGHLFPVPRATDWTIWSPQGWEPGTFGLPDPPTGARIRYHVGGDAVVAADSDDQEPELRLMIANASGATLRTLDVPGTPGMHEVFWDLRMAPAVEPEEGQGGGFGGGGAAGPKVLPGTYVARLEGPGIGAGEQRFEVRLDPRARITEADLMARHRAAMDVYALQESANLAGQAAGRLAEQLQAAAAHVEDGPDALRQEVTDARAEFNELRQRMGTLTGASRLMFSIEGVHNPPTADQLHAIEEAWEEAPGLVAELNQWITTRAPALYAQVYVAGLRPDPGPPVTPPTRTGGIP